MGLKNQLLKYLLHTDETYVKGRKDTDLAQAVYYTQAKQLNYMWKVEQTLIWPRQ